jgi:hypothetical protein
MHNTHRQLALLSAFLCTAVLLQGCSRKSPVPSSQAHIRGTVQSLDGQVLTVATAGGPVRVELAEPTKFGAVVRSDREHITDGSFLGITSVTQPDGSQRAVEVHVFPEAMRGTGEGSYAWDLPGAGGGSKMTNGTAGPSKMTNGTVASSKMTNGTVAASKMTNGSVTTQRGESALTLQYKDSTSGGSQTITLPPDIPVVAIEPGGSADLRPGAHVFVVAHRDSAGTLTADRVLAGRDGVALPM